jgi:hypothetical protein
MSSHDDMIYFAMLYIRHGSWMATYLAKPNKWIGILLIYPFAEAEWRCSNYTLESFEVGLLDHPIESFYI